MEGGFWRLMGVFEGVLRKVVCRKWFFRGEVVVNCVVNVDKELRLFRDEKWDTFLKFIFKGGRDGCSRPPRVGLGCALVSGLEPALTLVVARRGLPLFCLAAYGFRLPVFAGRRRCARGLWP
jgi:hypothetical protein